MSAAAAVARAKRGVNVAIAKRLNGKAYGELLLQVRPKRIESEAENRLALKIIEGLMRRGEERSREEDALLDLLVTLVEQFEAVAYPIASARSTPRDMLEFLMESNNLKPADIGRILGTRSHVSEILSGSREISKAQAKKLGERFHVSPALFL